ncbi:CBS domain-containing protein [bacterium]|nr:MAG: CBS domain-containing protein [bacterium]MCL4229948.1 CBS domain-containing protein [Dehalococcoidia bacterium]
MTSAQTGYLVCPSCGHQNIKGADSCEHCLAALTSVGGEGSEPLLPLTEIRLSRIKVVSPDTSVGEAVDVLRQEASGAVIVVQRGEVAGIFTERDYLKKIAGHPERLVGPVSLYMTPDPVILRDTDTMAIAVNKMGLGGFRHIPLVHGGRLVALVTGRDVMQWLMMRYFD